MRLRRSHSAVVVGIPANQPNIMNIIPEGGDNNSNNNDHKNNNAGVWNFGRLQKLDSGDGLRIAAATTTTTSRPTSYIVEDIIVPPPPTKSAASVVPPPTQLLPPQDNEQCSDDNDGTNFDNQKTAKLELLRIGKSLLVDWGDGGGGSPKETIDRSGDAPPPSSSQVEEEHEEQPRRDSGTSTTSSTTSSTTTTRRTAAECTNVINRSRSLLEKYKMMGGASVSVADLSCASASNSSSSSMANSSSMMFLGNNSKSRSGSSNGSFGSSSGLARNHSVSGLGISREKPPRNNSNNMNMMSSQQSSSLSKNNLLLANLQKRSCTNLNLRVHPAQPQQHQASGSLPISSGSSAASSMGMMLSRPQQPATSFNGRAPSSSSSAAAGRSLLLGGATTTPSTSSYQPNTSSKSFGLKRSTSNSLTPSTSTSRVPNAAAASIGRSLLNREPTTLDNNNQRTSFKDTFTASAATTPLPRTGTEVSLKSCLSSKGSLANMNMSKSNLRMSQGNVSSRSSFHTNGVFGRHHSSMGLSQRKNEEFGVPSPSMAMEGDDTSEAAAAVHNTPAAVKRNISFSHETVREYEVTLGDNPSVSSGAPISLGWRYNPLEMKRSLQHDNEDFDELSEEDDEQDHDDNDDDGEYDPSNDNGNDDDDNCSKSSRRSKSSSISSKSSSKNSRRKSTSDLRLSEHERGLTLMYNTNVSMEEIYAALQSTAQAKKHRKESILELVTEMKLKAQRKKVEVMKERLNMRRRRMGITDGGLNVSSQSLESMGALVG